MRKSLRFRSINDATSNIVYQAEYLTYQQRLVHMTPILREGDSSGSTTMASHGPPDAYHWQVEPIRPKSLSKHAVTVTVERSGAPLTHDVVMRPGSSDAQFSTVTDDIASPQALLHQPIVRTPTPPLRVHSPNSMGAHQRASMMQMKGNGLSLFHDFDNAGGKDLDDTFSDFEKRDGRLFTFDSPSSSPRRMPLVGLDTLTKTQSTLQVIKMTLFADTRLLVETRTRTLNLPVPVVTVTTPLHRELAQNVLCLLRLSIDPHRCQ
jgi:hypothetical protein